MNHPSIVATSLMALLSTPSWATSPSCIESEDVGERCRSPVHNGQFALADVDEDGVDDLIVLGWSEPRQELDDEENGIDWNGHTTIRWMRGSQRGVDLADVEIGAWWHDYWSDDYGQSSYVVEDVDADGHVDIVVSEQTWLGDGSGGFLHTDREVGLPYNWQQGRLTDLDGDGRRDLVFVDGGAARVHWRRADGTWEHPHQPLPLITWDFVFIDMDGDGDRDLVQWDARVGSTMWLSRESARTFAAPQYIETDLNWPLAAGDLNGDGREELVSRGSVVWFEDDNTMRVEARGSRAVGELLEVRDLDEDGFDDIIQWGGGGVWRSNGGADGLGQEVKIFEADRVHVWWLTADGTLASVADDGVLMVQEEDARPLADEVCMMATECTEWSDPGCVVIGFALPLVWTPLLFPLMRRRREPIAS